MKTRFLKISALFLAVFALNLSACKKKENDTPETTPPAATAHKVVANGGFVNTIGSEDGTHLAVVQMVPSINVATNAAVFDVSTERESSLQNNTVKTDLLFPSNTPIMFFFNDTIDINSVQNNVVIKVNNKIVFGTITINASAQGNAIMSIVPFIPFKPNQEISISLNTGLQDDGGLTLPNILELIFKTSNEIAEPFDTNYGFENDYKGVIFIGDGDVIEAKGNISPFEGNKYAAISSGNQVVSGSGSSVDNASSVLIAGPINAAASTITFNYDFMSAEFNDYVNSKFDDSFMVNVIGPNGSISKFITSVNTVGFNNKELDFPNMPDGGDSYAGHTEWKQETIDVSGLGQPLYVTFLVTDVSDKILSSIVAIDDIIVK